jgi:pre-rRNA-processing protein IPI3
MANGKLLFARESHYQPLTQICFTDDETLLLTGGDDAIVNIWRVRDLVDFNMRSEEIMPVQSWNEHNLPITGLICGNGTSVTARVYTSSLDQTVRVNLIFCHSNVDMGCGLPVFAHYNFIPKPSECTGY